MTTDEADRLVAAEARIEELNRLQAVSWTEYMAEAGEGGNELDAGSVPAGAVTPTAASPVAASPDLGELKLGDYVIIGGERCIVHSVSWDKLRNIWTIGFVPPRAVEH